MRLYTVLLVLQEGSISVVALDVSGGPRSISCMCGRIVIPNTAFRLTYYLLGSNGLGMVEVC